MTRFFTDSLQEIRVQAVRRVGDALLRLGFRAAGERRWRGALGDPASPTAEVDVVLPPDFPDALPEILLSPVPERATPHVDHRGKLCYAPDQGTLVDADHPEDIVLQALDMASRVLTGAGAGALPAAIEPEFEAYWQDDHSVALWSICPPDSPSGVVTLTALNTTRSRMLVAPSEESARKWCEATGRTPVAFDQGFLIRGTSVFLPDRFAAPATLRQMLKALETHATPADVEALRAWLADHGLPAILLIAATLTTAHAVALFAVRLPALPADAAREAQRGFRAGRVPHALQVARAQAEPVGRLSVARFDPEYLLPRGGAELDLLTKRVVVVGCGAVGSHAASALAASGIGQLTLIDPDAMNSENVHRHALGAAHVGRQKTEALRAVLLERFPHLDIRSLPERVEAVLDADAPVVLNADLVVVALGHETLELRLNRILGNRAPRVHVWLEPLGLGGHALRTGLRGAAGCLECIFRRDPEQGLTNMASLAAPNQPFQQTLGGCRGTFTPFGALDALHAATLASRACLGLLVGANARPALHTWCIDKARYTAAGYALSRRGASLADGASLLVDNFSRPDCPVCASWNP